MKWQSIAITLIGIVLQLGMSISAKAGETECLEFYSPQSYDQDIRHRVDLETGLITTFEYERSSTYEALRKSSNGRYSIEPGNPGLRQLAIIDHETDTRLVVSEKAESAVWSPDSAWLAYIQVASSDAVAADLILYNVETQERQQRDFEVPTGLGGTTQLLWSPDSRQIALLVVENIDTQDSQLSLFSIPDLTLRHNFEVTLFAAEMLWSPSGQFLIVSSRVIGEMILIDTRDGHTANTLLARDVGFYFLWSPTEEFLVVYLTVSDFTNQLVVLNQWGEHLIDDLYVPASQYTLSVAHHWLSDHQLLVEGWDNGFNNLTLIDLQTGERQILQDNVGRYALSSDQHTVAFQVLDIQDLSKSPQEIRFFDLTRDDPAPLKNLDLDAPARRFLWRVDRESLIVLFDDYSLQEYDFETEVWRFIATIPDDQRWSMRRVVCEE